MAVMAVVFAVIGIVRKNSALPTKDELAAVKKMEESEWVSVQICRKVPYETLFVVSIGVRNPDTDATIAEIVPYLLKLRRVRLQLAGTNFSDQGLELLTNMDNTREILLKDTQVTPAGLAWLSQHASHCEVVEKSISCYEL